MHSYYVNKTFKDDPDFIYLNQFIFELMDCFDAFFNKRSMEYVFEYLIPKYNKTATLHKGTQSTKDTKKSVSTRTTLTIFDIEQRVEYLRALI